MIVKFLVRDPSGAGCGYDFECVMSAVPRIGEEVILPSEDPNADMLENKETGKNAFTAIVIGVIWVPCQHEDGGPDAIVEADIDWV